MRVVVPFSAVTTVVMRFGPTPSAIGSLAAPDVTAVPLTVTVAPADAVVGVMRMLATGLATLAVYVPVSGLNAGDRLAPTAVSEESVASVTEADFPARWQCGGKQRDGKTREPSG